MNDSLQYPVIFARDLIPVPHSPLELWVGRDFTIRTLQAVQKSGVDAVVVCAQRDPGRIEEPQFEDIYEMGALCRLEKMISFEESHRVYLSVESRFQVQGISQDNLIPQVRGSVKIYAAGRKMSVTENDENLKIIQAWNQKYGRDKNNETLLQLKNERDLVRFTDLTLSLIAWRGEHSLVETTRTDEEIEAHKKIMAKRQKILCEDDAELRFTALMSLVQAEANE